MSPPPPPTTTTHPPPPRRCCCVPLHRSLLQEEAGVLILRHHHQHKLHGKPRRHCGRHRRRIHPSDPRLPREEAIIVTLSAGKRAVLPPLPPSTILPLVNRHCCGALLRQWLQQQQATTTATTTRAVPPLPRGVHATAWSIKQGMIPEVPPFLQHPQHRRNDPPLLAIVALWGRQQLLRLVLCDVRPCSVLQVSRIASASDRVLLCWRRNEIILPCRVVASARLPSPQRRAPAERTCCRLLVLVQVVAQSHRPLLEQRQKIVIQDFACAQSAPR